MSHTPDADAPEEIVWQGRFVTAKRRGRWEYAGRARGIRAAVIIALDGDHVILVSQYRVPLGKESLELPAGLVGDEAGLENEAVEDAAARELEEETGYRADRIEKVLDLYSSPGMLSESFALLQARGLTKVSDGGGTASEDITVHRVPLSGLRDYVAEWQRAGKAVDVKVAILLGGNLLGTSG
jgi:ADP-ribose pyrophosphatase